MRLGIQDCCDSSTAVGAVVVVQIMSRNLSGQSGVVKEIETKNLDKEWTGEQFVTHE
jgi:hypothetical protein